MDAKLVQKEAIKLRKEIGPRAEVLISVSDGRYENGSAVSCGVYPRGMHGDGYTRAFTADANSWTDLFEKARIEWAKYSDKYRRETVRKMALEIIRLTAEGNCTDSALRGDKFTADEVAEYGAEACEDANQIASNGPFSIATVKNANAA